MTADIDINGKSLGSEVDLQLNINVMKDVQLPVGYSFMLGTDTFEQIPRTFRLPLITLPHVLIYI